MTKRLTSKHKVDRRLKTNLWGRPKSPFNSRNYKPGQHGKSSRVKTSDYGIQLQAKQKLKLNLPADIKKIHKLFKKNKKQLYVVGGAVRDAILGKSPKDFDLATDATPDEVLAIAKQGKFKTVEVGKSFGVVIVNGHEIATFRKDIGNRVKKLK